MYGMVNQAIKGLVPSKFCEGSRNRIAESASVSPEDFIFIEYDPDEVTCRLVGATSMGWE